MIDSFVTREVNNCFNDSWGLLIKNSNEIYLNNNAMTRVVQLFDEDPRLILLCPNALL